MSRIDQFLIQELRSELAEIQESIKAIRFEHGSGRDAEAQRSCARHDIKHVAYRFSEWAKRVVEAFGLEMFPEYSSLSDVWREGPHLGSDDLAESLTGVKDQQQAGLRIIYWAVHGRVLWVDSAAQSIANWAAERFIIKCAGAYCARQEPFEWAQMAFESLVRNWELNAVAAVDDRADMTCAEIARFLFDGNSEAETRRVRDWIRQGKIRASKSGEGRSTSYIVSRSELEFRRKAVKNKDPDEQG